MVIDELRLPAEASSVGVARHRVRALLAGVDPDVADDAVWLTSELVTNAVLHAGSAVVVSVEVGTQIRVGVHDNSLQGATPRDWSTEAVSGRGLSIVAMLADDWGTSWDAAGKTIWFRLAVTPATSGQQIDRTIDTVVAVQVAGDSANTLSLVGVPVILYEVMREHNEALIREFAVTRLNEANDFPAFPTTAEISAADNARIAVSEAFDRWQTANGSDPSPHADIFPILTAEHAAGLRLLEQVCVMAEVYAAAGRLLTRPAVEELRRLRQWCFGDLLRQLEGQQPTAWRRHDQRPSRIPVQETDAMRRIVSNTPSSVIVGDRDNRIVAVSDAVTDLLGWTASDLVGQRITAVVPPALRETHVAGFTRHLVTGRRHILDQVVNIDAWHQDGYPVPIVLTLRVVDDGARFYVAELTKRD